MNQEYIYKAGVARAEIIDRTISVILETRRPITFAILNVVHRRWLWKIAGIKMIERFKSPTYSQYEVFQYNDLLATFDIKQEITTA